ncbi:MAG: Ig-like domain-containing protein, partial [Pontibacter sp.]|nr:Ig-like domain-containing protein [Pontibacter sp.]
AGNANEASNQLKLDYDATKPKLTLSTEAPAIVNEPFSVTFTFDEPVSGFELADITVTNGTAANLRSSGEDVYTATIQPDTDGQVSISVAANKAFDAAGNGNTASGTVTRVYDVEPPTVVVSTAAPDPTNAPFRVQITFSEDVKGFVAEDVRVTNGSPSSLKKESGSSYSVMVTPAASGVVAVLVAADVAEVMAANGNKASNELRLTYDADRPAVVLSTQATSPINTSFTVSFTLSEAVSGFELADLALGNASASDFRKTADDVYTATIQPATDGKVSIRVPANSMQDAAANGNEASNKLELVYDGTAPAGYTVQFVPELVDIDNQAQVSLTISGAEAGASYHYSIKSSNGGPEVAGTGVVSASAFTIPDLNLTALHDGTLTVSLYLTDNAGNKGLEVTDQVQKLTKNIAEVKQPEPITVPFKTEFGSLPLPAEVAVTYTNGENDNLKVKWGAGDYSGTIPGSYLIIGELELKENTSNTNNLVARATVVVEPNRAPTDLQLSSNTFRPDISPNELIGNFTTTDSDDDTHTYALVNGQGDESNGLFKIVNNELYLVSNRGLSGKSTFSIRVRRTDPYPNTIDKNFTLTKTLYQPEGGLKLVNAFSPNNDGINDLWVVPELRYYNSIQVEVFDRAGVRLFTTNDPEKGWDGRGKDGRILQGSYFYIIRIQDIDLVQKGVVTVLK